MKPLALGVLTGVLVATIVASLVFALTDRGSAPSGGSPALPALTTQVKELVDG
ncbi:hypothetical protein ABZ897_45880 [Nonomuraea sp. NPDC046802]|uniref:hypothetical protein n=1 Tax=Nonomuraea sp. NPDC046802 TaxID=3154919 RepID=UPI0033CE68C0